MFCETQSVIEVGISPYAEIAFLRMELVKRDVIIAEQSARIIALEQEIVALKKLIFGKRSEKMPSPKDIFRREKETNQDRESALQTRQDRRAARANLTERTIVHEVSAEKRQCPHCLRTELKKVGEGKRSVIFELVPAQVERQIHIQETLACPCGDYIVTADGPAKPVEGGQYGPKIMAHVVTAKCCDSIPLYRMEKQFKRQGIELSRSTFCNLFHQSAQALKPIWERMLETVPQYDLVLADETPLPVEVLGLSSGTLLVDGYSGYNKVCTPDARERAGCWAHVRRKFFESQATAPEQAKYAMEQILSIYRIEYEAASQNVKEGPPHLLLRQTKSLPLVKAFTYSLNNWEALNVFLGNARVPIDNNASERALRIVALGRKNYLFAGNHEAARNLAGLYSLIATCELNEVNPEKYLADTLIRVQSHPQKLVDQLLPHAWKSHFA
jgi:transposase